MGVVCGGLVVAFIGVVVTLALYAADIYRLTVNSVPVAVAVQEAGTTPDKLAAESIPKPSG